MAPPVNGGLIVTTLEHHEERLRALETGLILNDERDADRDKKLERFEKEIRQNTTTINMLNDTLGGDTGLIETTKKTRDSMNKSAGFLAFVGVAILTVGGWFFWMSMENQKEMKSIIKDLSALKAKVE